MTICRVISVLLLSCLCVTSSVMAQPETQKTKEEDYSWSVWLTTLFFGGGIAALYKFNQPRPSKDNGRPSKTKKIRNEGCSLNALQWSFNAGEDLTIRGQSPIEIVSQLASPLTLAKTCSQEQTQVQVFGNLDQAVENLEADEVIHELFKNSRLSKKVEDVRRDLNTRKSESARAEEKAKIQLILDLINLAYLTFESPSRLTARTELERMQDAHPYLFNNYQRLNMQGDGSCWLSGLLYITLNQLLANENRLDAFRKSMTELEEIRDIKPHVSVVRNALDELVELAKTNGNRRAAIQYIMTNFEYAYHLRMFVRMVLANAREQSLSSSLITFADSAIFDDVRELNAEGGNEELGIFAQIFHLDLHVIARFDGEKTPTFYYSLAINQGLRDQNVGDMNPNDVGVELFKRGLPLLISTKSHYAILEPITVTGDI